MKIAYLILCHKDPEQVLRLIRRLDNGDVLFVVHVDKRAERYVYNTIVSFASTRSNVYLSERCRCFWGGFGIVQATINCIKALLELSIQFDYAVLLSGQDYPIKSNSQIQSFFQQNRGNEFIESFSLHKSNRWSEAVGKFNAASRVEYWTIFLRSRNIQIRCKRTFPLGLEPFGGSQWWCLSRELLEYIAAFIQTNSDFVRYFRATFIPDESFFQTVVANSPFRNNIVSDDMRYADWDNPNPSLPRTLDANDFLKLKASYKLFARKVEAVRSDTLLDKLDRDPLL
jgi:core-2/I-Branching enzyme